jgi:hypothetical protein
MKMCGYCGGRVVQRDGRHVHASDGDRIPAVMLTPGDYASAGHNRAGTPVGGYDIVNAGAAREYVALSLSMGEQTMTMPSTRWGVNWSGRIV